MPPPPVPTQPKGLSAQPAVPVRGTGGPASDRARTGGWLMIAGGAVVLASAFLPRLTVGPGVTAESGILATGIGTLVLAGFAIAKGLQVVRPGTLNMRLSSPIVTGLLLLVLAGLRYASLTSDIDALNAQGFTASIANGFWISVIGSAIVLLGGALIQQGERAR